MNPPLTEYDRIMIALQQFLAICAAMLLLLWIIGPRNTPAPSRPSATFVVSK